MRRRYASSVHSQKSATSAKSGRSFLSLNWPSTTANKTNPEPGLSVKNDDTIASPFSSTAPRQGLWQNIKNWLPSGNDHGRNSTSSTMTPLKKFVARNDSDSITTKSTSASSTMSTISTKSRLRQFLTFTTGNRKNNPSNINSSPNNGEFLTTQSPDSNNSSSKVMKKNKDTKMTASPTYSSSSLPLTTTQPRKAGILINHGDDTEEAIAERLKRKHQRREHISKLQNQRRSIHYHPTRTFHSSSLSVRNSHDHLTTSISCSIAATTATAEEPVLESSSSDTLLTDEIDSYWQDTIPHHMKSYALQKPAVTFHQNEEANRDDQEEHIADGDGWGYYNPRIMFVEPSPVPRFRNVAPPPPPSPLYLSITVPASHNTSENATDSGGGEKPIVTYIQSPSAADDEHRPTVYTTMKINDTAPLPATSTDCVTKESRKEQCLEDDEEEQAPMDEHDRNICMLIQTLQQRPIEKPVLHFHRPWHRGQTITFSLKNTFPEDHIILFKFMTSTTQPIYIQNANRHSRASYSDERNTLCSTSKGRRQQQSSVERYFVRPSAGKIISSGTDQMNIMLFLNQVPAELLETENREPSEVSTTVAAATKVKDKIIVKWAAIQRNTRIEEWVNSLQESTRRKWIDMLDEEWPDQVTIRMTRIKVRFDS